MNVGNLVFESNCFILNNIVCMRIVEGGVL